MNEVDAGDELRRWLAYGHPLFMAIAIATAALAARSGLRMRRARTLGTARDRGDRARHLRFAKLAVAMVLAGAAGGPLSMAFLRDRAPFETAHAWIGLATVLLFGTVALLGRRMERGDLRPREAHAVAALCALLASGVAAVTGFVLLP